MNFLLNGRVWLWRERILAFTRIPLTRDGWRSNPWQRQPSELLPPLLFLAAALWLLSGSL